MKPVPQVGDIWKWTSEGSNITYVLLLERHDEMGKKYWNDVDIRFTGLQIYGEGWHAKECGDIDDWDFGDSVDYGWEFIA